MVDLFGAFNNKVDAKGRLTLPAKFRKVLPKELVVSRELEGNCLYVFEQDSFNDWVESLFESKFGGYDPTNREHVRFRSALKAGADLVEVDSAGRIALNSKLRDSVGIDREVVIVGNTGYFEVWDKNAYENDIASIDLGIFYS